MEFMKYVEEMARNPGLLRKNDEHVVESHRNWYQALAPVIEQGSNLPFAIIKGDVLSVLAYGEIGYRGSGDIDLLVSPRNKEALCCLLIENEFRPLLFNSDGTPRQMSRREQIMMKNSH